MGQQEKRRKLRAHYRKQEDQAAKLEELGGYHEPDRAILKAILRSRLGAPVGIPRAMRERMGDAAPRNRAGRRAASFLGAWTRAARWDARLGHWYIESAGTVVVVDPTASSCLKVS